MKILITGGLGHIGSYIIQNISKIKKIKKIYVIDNLSTQRYSSLFNLPKTNKKIIFIQSDLSQKKSLNKLEKVNIVLNLASITDAEGSLKIKKKIYKNNLGIFNNILIYCKKNSAKLIHISSTSVYGEQNGLVDENCKVLRPKSPYAEIKLIEENLLKKNSTQVNFVTFRFGTISGVSKGMRFHTAVNKFCLNTSLGLPLPLWRGMENKPRPYLSLGDAFLVIKFTIEKNFFKNDIFNILSQNLTLKQIVCYYKKYKKNTRVKYQISKLINQFPYEISNKKFCLQAFKPKFKISNDIRLTLNLFKNLNNEM
jgi:nucleoside-diphosphate-sugar epimerase